MAGTHWCRALLGSAGFDLREAWNLDYVRSAKLYCWQMTELRIKLF
jgi:hypothetical protein